MRVDEMDETTVGRALYFEIFSAKQKVIGGKKDAPLSSPLNRIYLATNIRRVIFGSCSERFLFHPVAK